LKIIETLKNFFKMLIRKTSLDATKGSIIGKLILIALPIMLTSLLNNLYEIVDTIWLGRYSESAIASAQVSRTLIWFLTALGMGIGMGGGTLISQAKGANNKREIALYSGQTISVALVISFIVSTIALIFPRFILTLMNTPEAIMKDAVLYIQINLGPSPIIFIGFAFLMIMNGTGNTLLPFVFTLITVILNAILDPLLIFGIGPFPEMGVSGAAIATVFSRILVTVGGVFFLLKGKLDISIKLDDLRPQAEKIKNILKIGIPNSIDSWGTSLGFVILMTIVNQVTVSYGNSSVVNAYGISNTIIGMYFLVTLGLGQAVSIVVGQNIGADDIKRAEKSVWQALYIGMGLLSVGTVFMFIYAGEFSNWFIPATKEYSEATRLLVTNMLRITASGVITYGLSAIIFGAFQGAGYTIPNMIIGLARLWVLRIPLAYILAFGIKIGSFVIKPMGADGIWHAMNISNIVVGIVAFTLFLTGKWKKQSYIKKESNIDMLKHIPIVEDFEEETIKHSI